WRRAGPGAAPRRRRPCETRGSWGPACTTEAEGTSRRTSPGRPMPGAGGGAWCTDTMPRRAMPTWQDRITNDTEPAIRVERDLRYRYAAPAIAGAKLWCDLGGGGPVPAGFAGEIVLVNATDGPERARTLGADLNTSEGVAA